MRKTFLWVFLLSFCFLPLGTYAAQVRSANILASAGGRAVFYLNGVNIATVYPLSSNYYYVSRQSVNKTKIDVPIFKSDNILAINFDNTYGPDVVAYVIAVMLDNGDKYYFTSGDEDVSHTMYRYKSNETALPPPKGWKNLDFDDSGWWNDAYQIARTNLLLPVNPETALGVEGISYHKEGETDDNSGQSQPSTNNQAQNNPGNPASISFQHNTPNSKGSGPISPEQVFLPVSGSKTLFRRLFNLPLTSQATVVAEAEATATPVEEANAEATPVSVPIATSTVPAVAYEVIFTQTPVPAIASKPETIPTVIVAAAMSASQPTAVMPADTQTPAALSQSAAPAVPVSSVENVVKLQPTATLTPQSVAAALTLSKSVAITTSDEAGGQQLVYKIDWTALVTLRKGFKIVDSVPDFLETGDLSQGGRYSAANHTVEFVVKGPVSAGAKGEVFYLLKHEGSAPLTQEQRRTTSKATGLYIYKNKLYSVSSNDVVLEFK